MPSYILVHRRGYWRRSHWRINRYGKSVMVKGTYVPPTTYKMVDRGAVGRGKKVIKKLVKGELTRFGYSLDKNEKERHKALKKAIEDYSDEYGQYVYGALIRKLNAIRVLTKRTQPENWNKLTKDMDYIRKLKEKAEVERKPREVYVKTLRKAKEKIKKQVE